MAGYYVAEKKLPSWVIAFSSNSTGESAWLLLGLTGMGYAVGFYALCVVLGEFLGVLLAGKYVARPFKAYTDRHDSIRVPDYLDGRARPLLRDIPRRGPRSHHVDGGLASDSGIVRGGARHRPVDLPSGRQ